MKSAETKRDTFGGLAKRPLGRRLTIFLAVLALWLLGGIGLALMHSKRWSFLLLGGFDISTVGQIGSYYLARVAAQLPALGFTAIIIGLSDFRRPVRTACFTVVTYCGLMTFIRLARHPWAVAPNLDQSIPILAEAAQLILMVAFAGFFTWLLIWLAGALTQLSRHRTYEREGSGHGC